MEEMGAGARIDLDARETVCVLEAQAGTPRLSAALVIRREGRQPEIVTASGKTQWRLDLTADPSAKCEVLLYMNDETEIGRVEDRGGIICKVGDKGFRLGVRKDRHGAVFLAEIYTHSGQRRMRVRGDGWHMGIRAYCRKEDLPVEVFLTERPQTVQAPSPRTGQTEERRESIGSGSGVIVSDGYVVTNAHVVRDSRSQTIHGVDGEFEGRIITVDEEHDLALLRVQGLGGTPIPIRPMGTLYLGESIIASGYPLRDVLGDDLKMTHGNVSGMKGPGGNIAGFQFSAPIASGSSGGAVTDQNGNLVGIIAAALAHDTMRRMGATSENTNFAIRASLVAELLSAHEVDWGGDIRHATSPAETARAIRRSLVSITLR